jgi:transcriptional regulator with XRE-family HTH domain
MESTFAQFQARTQVLREEREWSQAKLAVQVGVTRLTINSNGSNYTSGEPDNGRNIRFARVVHDSRDNGKSV